jgi:hypothetical protein
MKPYNHSLLFTFLAWLFTYIANVFLFSLYFGIVNESKPLNLFIILAAYSLVPSLVAIPFLLTSTLHIKKWHKSTRYKNTALLICCFGINVLCYLVFDLMTRREVFNRGFFSTETIIYSAVTYVAILTGVLLALHIYKPFAKALPQAPTL